MVALPRHSSQIGDSLIRNWVIHMTISVLGIDLAKNTYQLHGLKVQATQFLKDVYHEIGWLLILRVYRGVVL
jgi:hypothetical protein